jgi:hypothetical protein
MSLRPRQNNSQRYPPETQQEVPHAVQISRLRLPRLQADESIPKFALVPLIFGVRQEKHKSAVAPLGCISIHPMRGVFVGIYIMFKRVGRWHGLRVADVPAAATLSENRIDSNHAEA